ncbi:MAG: DUF1643 domain-containing protein [Chloroflexota bacterium]
MHRDATLDVTGAYRYLLIRSWDSELPCLCWILLNPSTADPTRDDPTIRRCISFSAAWGYGTLRVVNLFGFRSCRPAGLRTAADPVGPENELFVRSAIDASDASIVGWGVHGAFRTRDQAVNSMLESGTLCLGRTQEGHPRHPLYLPRGAQPVLWRA